MSDGVESADEISDEADLEEPEEAEAEEAEPVVTAPAAPAAAGKPARGPAGRRRGAAGPAAAPSPSELAVHVDDRVSSIYVIVAIVVFAAILLYGIFLGTGGLITGTPSPEPSPTPAVSASPAAPPSAEPSPSE